MWVNTLLLLDYLNHKKIIYFQKKKEIFYAYIYSRAVYYFYRKELKFQGNLGKQQMDWVSLTQSGGETT